MNSPNFVNSFRRACIQLMEATDQAQELINQFGDMGEAVTLDPYFNTTPANAADPLTKADILAAGASLGVIFAALGSGPGSNRDKLNRMR